MPSDLRDNMGGWLKKLICLYRVPNPDPRCKINPPLLSPDFGDGTLEGKDVVENLIGAVKARERRQVFEIGSMQRSGHL